MSVCVCVLELLIEASIYAVYSMYERLNLWNNIGMSCGAITD